MVVCIGNVLARIAKCPVQYGPKISGDGVRRTLICIRLKPPQPAILCKGVLITGSPIETSTYCNFLVARSPCSVYFFLWYLQWWFGMTWRKNKWQNWNSLLQWRQSNSEETGLLKIWNLNPRPLSTLTIFRVGFEHLGQVSPIHSNLTIFRSYLKLSLLLKKKTHGSN